jgi:hypothetical protein
VCSLLALFSFRVLTPGKSWPSDPRWADAAVGSVGWGGAGAGAGAEGLRSESVRVGMKMEQNGQN